MTIDTHIQTRHTHTNRRTHTDKTHKVDGKKAEGTEQFFFSYSVTIHLRFCVTGILITEISLNKHA